VNMLVQSQGRGPRVPPRRRQGRLNSICTGSLDKPSHEWGGEVKCAACTRWFSRSSRVNGPVKHWDNGLTMQWYRRRLRRRN